MGKWKRLLGREKHNYHAIQIDDDWTTGAQDISGKLLRIRPYSGSEGIPASAGMVQSLHDEHDPGTYSAEAWFDQGKLQFFARAPDDDGAERVTSRIRSNFPDSEVIPLEGPDPAFPDINAGDWLVGATASRSHPRYPNLDYIPIRHYEDGKGFHKDPWTEILESMLSDDQTRVVVQVTFESHPENWVDGGFGPGNMSTYQVKRNLEQPRVKGWFNIREVPPPEGDQIAADVVEDTNRLAFKTNIRVLAASPSKIEALNRASGAAKMFNKFYNSKTDAGLKAKCVDGRRESTQRERMVRHINVMRERGLTQDGCIMQVEELAGVVPLLPPGDITTPKIDWVHTRTGGEIPADAPKHGQGQGQDRGRGQGPLGSADPVDDRPEGW